MLSNYWMLYIQYKWRQKFPWHAVCSDRQQFGANSNIFGTSHHKVFRLQIVFPTICGKNVSEWNMFPNVMALVPVVVCDARWMLLGSSQAESHRTAAIGIFQKAASLQALKSDMQLLKLLRYIKSTSTDLSYNIYMVYMPYIQTWIFFSRKASTSSCTQRSSGHEEWLIKSKSLGRGPKGDSRSDEVTPVLPPFAEKYINLWEQYLKKSEHQQGWWHFDHAENDIYSPNAGAIQEKHGETFKPVVDTVNSWFSGWRAVLVLVSKLAR